MSNNTKELLTAILIVLLTGFMITFGLWNVRLRDQNTHLRSINAELVKKAELRTEQLSRCCGVLVPQEREVVSGVPPDTKFTPAAWASGR
jgi:hypothetical protein